MAKIYNGLVTLCTILSWISITNTYLVKNHPCCQEPSENVTLAMVIDAYEIYGHDPTDKLDHLAHYQIEMLKIKRAPDQYIINEHIHIATDHLARFIHMHIKELKVLLIALDDAIDNMLTMYDNHNAIKAERVSAYNVPFGGSVPAEFYISQGFVHAVDEKRYFLEDDPNVPFAMDNYFNGLECHIGICIYRFPIKKNIQHVRDISTLPKAIVKCGTIMYKLPPLTAVSCIITSGNFILDFNIQGLRFRHFDYILFLPNGHTFYTKERYTPLVCDHHVCEWNYTNFYGGPFIIPGDPAESIAPVPPYVEKPPEVPAEPAKPPSPPANFTTLNLEGCWFMFPPNYGSIAGVSYLDAIAINEYRFSCQGSGNKGLYWYPQWMGAPPHHPYPKPTDVKIDMPDIPPVYYPHQNENGNEE